MPAKKAAFKKGESKKATAKASAAAGDASQHIDKRIAELGDWRGETLAHVRRLIHEAIPGVVEEWKWANPVWSSGGIICTGESYKSAVKLTFPHGAALADPADVFNSSLEGGVRRAVDIRQKDKLDERALKGLFKAAASLNAGKAKR